MKIKDRIRNFFFRGWQLLFKTGFGTGWSCGCFPFGNTIFRNAVEILTDLCNDVEWTTNDMSGRMAFAEFKVFFERNAQSLLWRYYRQGFAVVGRHKTSGSLRIMDANEYTQVSKGDATYVEAINPEWECHVVSSDIFREEAMSDYDLCLPFIKFLDNILNASNTSSEKMGTFVVATPETPSSSPTAIVMNKEQKQELEKEMEDEYGSLSHQRHIMLLPRGMKFQTVSLDGLDRKLTEKVRLCVLVICDRIKVPANQVAIIDANSSKALANGSELREGDFAKYQSFERLLERTFGRLADELNLKVDYTIYNKPTRATSPTVTTEDNE